MKKLVVSIIGAVVMMASLTFFSTNEASAATESYKVKSTVNVLNIRAKASTKSKIIGKLKKNQTLLFQYEIYDKPFYAVRYKGKIAYVSSDYSKKVKPKNKWLGSYINDSYSGSGARYDMNVYKKTSTTLYFLSRTIIRTGMSDGHNWDFEFNNYYGKAKITSTNMAQFNSKGCKATFKIVGNSIKIYEKSKAGSCDYTGFGTYDNQIPIYRK